MAPQVTKLVDDDIALGWLYSRPTWLEMHPFDIYANAIASNITPLGHSVALYNVCMFLASTHLKTIYRNGYTYVQNDQESAGLPLRRRYREPAFVGVERGVERRLWLGEC